MAGRNDTNKRKAKDAAILGGTMLGGAAAATYLGTEDERRRKKFKKDRDTKRREKSKVRRAKIDATTAKIAQQKIGQLENINEKHLSARDKKIRRELINREKDVMKGLKPRTLTSIASKVGLKSIPGVGAFLSLFASTPAYGRGGNVNKKRR